MESTGSLNGDLTTEVWLLPHPDDELFCLDLRRDPSNQIHVFYFCKVPLKTSINKSVDRYQEAISAWSYVKCKKIHLHKIFTRFSDGQIFLEFTLKDYVELKTMVATLNPKYLVTPSFEGGHQDHDFIYAVARKLSSELNLVHLHFPTYRARNNSRIFFKVVDSEHKKLKSYETSIKSVLENVFLLGKMASKYKSQVKSLLVLYPLIVIATFRGKRGLRTSNITLEYTEVPFYQLRKRADSTKVMEAIEKLEKKHEG